MMQLVAEGTLGKNGADLRKSRGGIYITKIKVKGDDIKIIYELPREDTETKTVTFTCSEQPRQEFHQAIKHIFKTTTGLCGLDFDVWESGTITDISIKEGEEGIDVAIALHLELGQGAIKLNYTQEDISYDLKGEIDNLLAETEDYISGKRHNTQLSLNLDE